MFEQCLPNTLDTTTFFTGDNNETNTFIITGDIDAMWLRDSMNQVQPYMRFLKQDAHLQAMIEGLIRTTTNLVAMDPYANAHNHFPDKPGPFQTDNTQKPSFLGTSVQAMTNNIFERKFEVDSLCAFLKLCNMYYNATGSNAVFYAIPNFVDTVQLVLQVFSKQMTPYFDPTWSQPYYFQRTTPSPLDSLVKGIGPLFRYTGMLASPFRPSDDVTTYQFLVPANAMAVVELRHISSLMSSMNQPSVASAASQMADVIDKGIQSYAIVERMGKQVYAYEVDGYGNALFMDDANLPSNLALPFLGYLSASDPVYQQTRQCILSNATNPFYFSGNLAQGVGSPHTSYGFPWHLGLIAQAMTSSSDEEISDILNMLIASTAGSNFMHESFDPNNPANFTRPWFAWANSFFGQLILKLADERPHLIFKQ